MRRLDAITPWDWAIIGMVAIAVLLLPLCLGVVERRRRRAAWHRYFHEGGLVRSLLSRWKAQPRLTDDRTDKS